MPSPKPTVNPVNLAATDEKPSLYVIESRKRAMELMLLRRSPTLAVLQYAKEKWGTGPDTAKAWIKEIMESWRLEWKDDEDRVNQRLMSIKSLEDAIRQAHGIINETMVSIFEEPDPKDPEKIVRTPRRIYAHEPKVRLKAMDTLRGLEAELANIAGFKIAKIIPEIPIQPKAPELPPPQDTQEVKTGEIMAPEPLPAKTLGAPAHFSQYFLQVNVNEAAKKKASK